MRPATLVLGSILLLTPAAGLAQAPAGGAAVASSAPAAAEPAHDAGKLADPNIDRGLLFPTGETQPGGTLTLTDYEIFWAGLTYGITDRLQVGVVAQLIEGGFFLPDRMASGSLKYQVLRRGKYRLSLLLGSVVAQDRPDHHDPYRQPGDEENHYEFAPFGGLAGSICDDGCQSMVSANVNLVGGRGVDDDIGMGALYAVSLAARTSDHVKLVLEYSSSLDADGLGGHMVLLGVRLFNRHGALEAAGGVTSNEEGTTGTPVIFLSGSLRFGRL